MPLTQQLFDSISITPHHQVYYPSSMSKSFYSATESLESRFCKPEDEWDPREVDENGLVWDEFAGNDQSKLFGIFSHCQMNKEQHEVVQVNRVVLLQIGENGFNDEGGIQRYNSTRRLKKLRFD